MITMIAIAMLAGVAILRDNPLLLEWHNAAAVFHDPVPTHVGLALITHQLGYFDILPLYVVLMLMAPVIRAVGPLCAASGAAAVAADLLRDAGIPALRFRPGRSKASGSSIRWLGSWCSFSASCWRARTASAALCVATSTPIRIRRVADRDRRRVRGAIRMVVRSDQGAAAEACSFCSARPTRRRRASSSFWR